MPTPAGIISRRRLANRRKAFIIHYLRCWNATEAARAAGYEGDDETLASTGWRVMRDAKVQAALQLRLKTMNVSSDETLARIVSQATFDASQFIQKGEGGKIGIDLDALKAAGKGHLIKGIEYKDGEPVFKFHDSQKALEMLGKAHGLFKTVNEHSGPGGGPIQAQAVPVDYSKLTVEEIKSMLAIAAKMQPALPPSSG